MKFLLKIALLFFIIQISIFSKELEKVSLQLQWLDQFQFAGYYIAKEKGFYKDVNLDVDILPYRKDTDVVEKVIKEEATFATGRTSLLIHKNQGKKVIVLAAIFQHAPDALLVTNNKIITPSDLTNKKIMITNDAINSAAYISMLFSEGVSEKDFIKQKHSFNIEDLINGNTDALASYISNEPYILEKRGIKYKAFQPKDYGFDFYGDLLFTSKKELETNPNRVENFTKASIKGWKYAFNNIEESARLIYEKYNIQNKTIEALIYEGETLKKLAFEDEVELGHLNFDKFNEIAKMYRILGVLKKDYNLDDFLYDFLCLESEGIKYTQKEKNWLMKNKTIKVAVHKEWNPVEFFNQDEYSGISSGYLKHIKEKLNINFQIIKSGSWNEKLEKLKNNEIDMIMSIVDTPNRRKHMNFTFSYSDFPTVIVTKSNVNYIRNLKALDNKIVAVEKGFYIKEFLHMYNRKIKILEVDTTKEALKSVYHGSAYAYIGALPNIGYFIKRLKLTNLKISGEAPFKTKIAIATKKDFYIFNSILNKVLSSITNEEQDEIYNKWINVTYEHEVDYKIISIIALIGLLIFLLFFARNRGLQKELQLKEIFSKELTYLNKTLEYKNKELKELSENDTLTQIANRRKLDIFLKTEIQRSRRNNLKLSIILLDIDYFKKVNDTFGHKMGDKVLCTIADTLKDNIRIYDLVGRWGGEEFLIICPNTNLRQAYSLCEKLQKLVNVEASAVLNGFSITASFGIAQFRINDTMDKLIIRVDEEMYKSKAAGRNCIFPKISKK